MNRLFVYRAMLFPLSAMVLGWGATPPNVWSEGMDRPRHQMEEEDPAGQLERARILSERFKVPQDKIQELRKKDLGWGEISHLLVIANRSGQSINTILALKESGMGWGEIAQKYNLKLGEINRDVKATKEELRGKKQEMRREPEHGILEKSKEDFRKRPQGEDRERMERQERVK